MKTTHQDQQFSVFPIPLRLVCLLALGLALSKAHAATETWGGPTTDNLWSTPANWGATSPASGDDAVFPSLGGLRSVDLAGSQQINSVQFNSGNPNTYVLYDGTLDISSFIDQAGSADATFFCAVSFASAVTLSGAGSGNVYLQGGLNGSPSISMVGGNYWWAGTSGFNPAGLNITGGYLHLIGTNQVTFGSNVQIQNGGTMCVQGSFPSTVSAPGWDVLAGGTLKVNGTVTGPVNVSGGTFAAGCSPGSADVQGDLFFHPSASAEFELATPNIIASGNDWVSVKGNLTLDGRINIVALPGFGVGTYRLYNYSGVLTDNGGHLGQLPSGFACQLDSSTPGQVNLVVALASPQSCDVAVTAGFVLIANQLDHGSNTLSEVISNAPDGSAVYKYNNGSGTWSKSTYSAAAGSWSFPDLTLSPGEGAFLQSPSDFTLTFTGTPHVPVLPVSVPAGATYLLSRQTNATGNYDNIVGLPPVGGAKVYKWTGKDYQVFTFGKNTWSPAAPSAAVGEALWIQPAGGSGPPPIALPPSYTLNISAGLNLIANQLDHGSNTLNEVLPTVPDGTALYKFINVVSNGGWTISTYSAATGTWLNGGAITLSPGEGAFLDSPSAGSITFTGVPHVPVLPTTIPAGHAYLLSRQTNDVGTFENIVGTPPPDGATVYQWNGNGYVIFIADSASPTGWSDNGGNPVAAPTAPVGGALWIAPSGTGSPATTPASTGLTVISPAAGTRLCAGSTTTITWSGGNPGWNVEIVLADVPSWTAYSIITPSTPNNGSFVWNIPPGLPASTYLIYIQEVSGLTWTYGGNFAAGPCPTNACLPPPAGLGLWLPLDETSGTTSGNLVPGGNTGTRMNSPAVISGYVANSLSFNGANQFVTVPDYPAIDPGAGQDFSIDAWVKRAPNAPDSLPSIIVDKRDPNTGVGYSLALSYGNLIFQMNAGSGGYNNYRDTGTIPPDDKWHLVAVTIIRNQTNGGQFYIDGVPKASFDPTPYPGSLASSAPFQVAASPIGGNRPWLGAIDEVEYFQRALLPAEVRAIYLAGSAGKCKCLTPPANMGLWLPLDEPSGITSVNLAPSGNNGTHINAPTVISGYVANSLSFNGINQYVTVPDYAAVDPLAGQDFSIDAWIKRSANSPNSPPSIIVDKRDPNTGLGYSLALSYGNLIFQMNAGSGGYANYRDTGTIPPDNKWHLVAVTIIRNQTNGGQFYIDGVPKATFNPTPYAGSLASSAPFQVAASGYLGGNVPWLGAIDEVEYFQRALTAQEVLAIFNAGTAGKCKQGCGSSLNVSHPADKVVECGQQWAFDPPTASDPTCPNITIQLVSSNSTPIVPCGTRWVAVWRVTGCCTNSVTVSQTVNIVDTTPPVVNCSPGFSTDCSFAWSFTPPTATDACSGTNVNISVLNTTTNGRCPFSISRVWLVADQCGNSTTCTQTVVVGDSTPPSISCTASKTVECGSVWDFDRPAAADACSGNAVTVTVLSTVTNGTACSQVITRTWVATNPCGVTNTCSQTVTIRDTTPPVLACGHDKTVECNSQWAFDPPFAVDACCGDKVTVTILSTFTNSLQKCITAITRTWSATDCCGNSNTCAQTVTITDTTPPVFATVCVTNDTLLGGNNFTTPIPSSPSPGLLARLHAAGITQFKGFDQCTVNTYFAHTFTNLPHCITAATLKVRMKPCGDLCYNDAISLSFTSPSGVLQTNGSWGSYLGAGNPSPGLDSDNWCNHTSGQTFILNLAALPSGPTPNLLPQLNALGYLDFTSQDDSGVDSLELTITSCCYQPTKTVECGSRWTFDPPTATDACCAQAVTVSVFSTVTNGTCPKVATRTWQATDCCGNSSYFSQVVTMIDTTPPIVYCPGPITRYVCTSSDRVYYYVYAYDACSGYRPVTCTPASGSVFPLGTTIVSCTATDACGNVGSCSFPVTVVNQTITASAMLGIPDCFKLPTEPAPKSAQLVATYPGSCWRPFDYMGVNCAFGASFMNLPANLTCGQLWIRMKPNCSDNPENDGIAVGMTATNTWGWSSYIGGGNPTPGLTQNTWCDVPGCGQLFSLNLASMPNTGANLLPLINAAGSHKLDVFVQDDTGVDFAYLSYCYCRILPWWYGWEWATANAGLANGQNFASFSPLWSVGYPTNFSVTLAPGATHGIQLGLVPLNLGAISNASLTISAQTTLDPSASAITLTGDGSNTMNIALSAVRPGVTQVQLVFRLAGTVVFQETLPATIGSNLVSVLGGASMAALTATDTRALTVTDDLIMVTLDGPYDIKCPLCPPMVADEVDVVLPNPSGMADDLLSSLTLEASGLSEIQLSSAAVQVSGLYPQVTGDAVASAGGDQLTITPLNGLPPGTPVTNTIGFQIAVPASQAGAAGFGLQVSQNLNAPPTESNGVVSAVITGQVGADVLPAIQISAAQTIDGWALSADFSALGTTSLRLAIKQQGIKIAEVAWTETPHVPVLPTTWVVSADPVAPSVTLDWPEAHIITLGGTNYAGDEMQIIAMSPDLPFSAITAIQVQASGVDALTLSSIGIPPPVWVLQTPLITPSQMTIQWSGPAGGILESSPTVLGPWSPVPGQSGNSAVLPSPMTNGVPSQFFRVQSN